MNPSTQTDEIRDDDSTTPQPPIQQRPSWKRRVIQYILHFHHRLRATIRTQDGPSSSFPFPSIDRITGWIKVISTFTALLLIRELRLQRLLTSPPIIFIQQSQGHEQYHTVNNNNTSKDEEKDLTRSFILNQRLTEPSTLCDQGTSNNNQSKKSLSRIIKPSLLFTTSVGASLGAYIHRGPSDPRHETSFREYFKIGSDGTILALDWEVPRILLNQQGYTLSSIQHMLLHGPIQLSIPIIFILHGINNDSSYGYIRSLQRLCTDRGWITCAMNFRGCGSTNKNHQTCHRTSTVGVVEEDQREQQRKVGLNSPRPYHAGYTNDLRTVVNSIVYRCNNNNKNKKTYHSDDDTIKPGQEGKDVNEVIQCDRSEMTPIFLVGNSLGANIMTKYLGEEGMNQTLPSNILAGISRGNPLEIQGEKIHSPWAQLLAMGVKKTLFLHKNNRQAMMTMMSHDIHFQKALWKALFTSSTIGTWDRVMAPFMIRNDIIYPFRNKIGFHNGEEYWSESSSRKYVANVSIPLLILSSIDDFLVTHSALRSLNQCLSNPNVMVVKTKAGGHLGWQEAKENRYFGTCSFADSATVEFIAAVLEDRHEQQLLLHSRVVKVPNTNGSMIHSRL